MEITPSDPATAASRQRVVAAADVRRFGVGRAEERQVTEALIDACARGDLAGLMAVLDPAVSGDGDFGPGVPVPVATDAPTVARRLLGYFGHGATLVSQPVNGEPAVLAFTHRRLVAVLRFTVVDGLITDIHARGDATTLADVTAELDALRSP